MSIIKSIKQVLGLGPAAENHFWDGSVPNQLSLKRGTPDAPGAELIKALNGVLSFPNQGQSLTSNGYVKLPGGLIVQWGFVVTPSSDSATVTFPIPFPTQALHAQATVVSDGNSTNAGLAFIGDVPTTSVLKVGALAADTGFWAIRTVYWLAIGF